MTAAKRLSALLQTPYCRLFMLAGLAAVLIGAVLMFQSGPEPQFRPVMAEQPVIMPDGDTLYVQKYEVTVAEWNTCYTAGACSFALRPPAGKPDATTPATGLSHVDVGAYIAWINRTAKHEFRLPSLAEWEFMAAEVMPKDPDPVFTSPDLSWASAYLTTPQTKRALRPQGTFATTSQGIVDLNGNVWEWTNECYAGASVGAITPDRCPAFFVGGEHVAAMSYLIRNPARGGCAVGSPPAHLGMRLVTEQPL